MLSGRSACLWREKGAVPGQPLPQQLLQLCLALPALTSVCFMTSAVHPGIIEGPG